jgi:NitT/TauT family transport system substrate-binding protein
MTFHDAGSIRALQGRLSRRRLVQGAAALGMAAPLASLGRLTASAQDAKNNVIWVSPRGTLEVLDDYPYWVAKKYGYFGDIETELLPAIMEATSSAKAVADGQADMSYVSPGVFSLGVEQGIDLVSVFQMGAYDVFDIALPLDSPITTIAELEGKTIILGDPGWSGIVDPMLKQGGIDPSSVRYVSAGSGWAQALAEGQGDAALSWAGLRAQWKATGLEFNYILGTDVSKFPANSFQIRRSDFENAELADLYTRYLRGWAMGLEFGYQNPRAATQITMEEPSIAPALQETFQDLNVAVESMWQLATVYRGDWATRTGWGEHSSESWQIFLDTIKEIGQLTADIAVADIIKNDYVAGANDFDHDQVAADAAAFELSEAFAAVTPPADAPSASATPTS